MFFKFPIRILLACCLCPLLASGQTLDAKSKLGQQVSRVSDKKFKRETWRGGKQLSPLGKKSFHMIEYDKHYSSLGSQKASTAFDKKVGRKEYKTPDVVTYDRVPRKVSSWSGRQAELKKKSRLETSQKAPGIGDRQLYEAILQDTPQAYADMADQLSMKQINRFAFRRNRSKESPKAIAAGQGTAAP
ncbi:MAG: hypothetical protein ACON39_07695 [Coraliomargaritaceae bacterium]